ncbi:hypothetical protein CGRA01v4_06816 [Colletotrichum graminicola]|nr:hypothetical protein CGRA01v4_06816 [Colletotrichum graminicola]
MERTNFVKVSPVSATSVGELLHRILSPIFLLGSTFHRLWDSHTKLLLIQYIVSQHSKPHSIALERSARTRLPLRTRFPVTVASSRKKNPPAFRIRLGNLLSATKKKARSSASACRRQN